jgi:hypothetical protein
MGAQNRKRIEEHKPFVYKINYIVYTSLLTCVMFYYYVTEYGGIMPPSGTFGDFIGDFWLLLSTGFLAPLLTAFVTGYLLKKRRSTDA